MFPSHQWDYSGKTWDSHLMSVIWQDTKLEARLLHIVTEKEGEWEQQKIKPDSTEQPWMLKLFSIPPYRIHWNNVWATQNSNSFQIAVLNMQLFILVDILFVMITNRFIALSHTEFLRVYCYIPLLSYCTWKKLWLRGSAVMFYRQ